MAYAPPSMKFCDLCVYARRGRPADGLRTCGYCGALLCDEHTHVYGANPRCVDCQKKHEAGELVTDV